MTGGDVHPDPSGAGGHGGGAGGHGGGAGGHGGGAGGHGGGAGSHGGGAGGHGGGEIAVFRGGGRVLLGGAILGGLGLLLTALELFFSPRQALHSYLVAFAYWFGIAIGALGWLMAFHAAHARWVVVIRRLLESMTAPFLLLPLLFVPVALGMNYLYLWVHASGPEASEIQALLVHKLPYLNVMSFLWRAVVYFVAFAAMAQLLRRWSVRQDVSGALVLTVWQRRLGAGGMPLVAILASFAAFDWLMSLHPRFYSTIFGLYYLAGGVVGAIALLIVVVVAADQAGLLRGLVLPSHYHSLGKLLLAFVCFWAYMAFSQFLLVWIGNLPEEIPWFITRMRGGWAICAAALAVAHFGLPFLALLSRDLKLRPRRLAAASVWILLAHYLDTWWVVMPRLHAEGPVPHWADLAAFCGVGGAACVAAVLWLRGRHPVPVRDPYLEESLRYGPP
jgi:hypothetical protein